MRVRSTFGAATEGRASRKTFMHVAKHVIAWAQKFAAFNALALRREVQEIGAVIPIEAARRYFQRALLGVARVAMRLCGISDSLAHTFVVRE